MKRLTGTLLLVGIGCSLASADGERTSLMRADAERETQKLVTSPEPAAQGISTSDLVTTRDLNQQIAALPGLSPTAKDVRVGTYRGRITLTGVVQSPEEKQRIEQMAIRQVGAMNVVSELEVQSKKRP